MNKDLAIVGAYPSTKEGVQILKENLLSLNEHFDIVLTTHYPADKEIQSLVKYYIYDIRNEFVVNENIHFWADYPAFYTEVFDDKTNTHHSFAVFRAIMNAINLTRDSYDDFFYIEGDCIFDEKDIITLKEIKTNTIKNNKQASFFTFPDFLSTLLFYSKTDFFINSIPFCKNAEAYELACQKVNSFGVLENYLYNSILSSNNFDNILCLENIQPTAYFPNSKIGINSFFEGQVAFFKSFRAHVVRVENTNEIAFVYVNNNDSVYTNDMEVHLDDQLVMTFPPGQCADYFYLYPQNDNFTVKIGNLILSCNKQEIINGRSFIRIKN